MQNQSNNNNNKIPSYSSKQMDDLINAKIAQQKQQLNQNFSQSNTQQIRNSDDISPNSPFYKGKKEKEKSTENQQISAATSSFIKTYSQNLLRKKNSTQTSSEQNQTSSQQNDGKRKSRRGGYLR